VRLLKIRHERRAGVAAAAGGVGLAAFAFVALSGHLEWALLLLAAGGYAVLVVAAGLYLRLRTDLLRAVAGQRTPEPTAEPYAGIEERIEAAAKSIDESLSLLRSSLGAQVAAVERSSARLHALTVQQRAERLANGGGGGREREIDQIRASELFDGEWYRAASGAGDANPAVHYVDVGARRNAVNLAPMWL
jgi:hypothetical protein